MINILKINMDKINDEIYTKEFQDKRHVYIICSEETKNLIILQCERFGCEVYNGLANKERFSTCCGCKILTDNSLELGDVDIR